MSDSNRVVCEQCGNEYSRIGSHWAKSKDCSHPEISDEKMALLLGYILGDGSLNTGSKNPYIDIQMASPNHLKHIDEELGWLSTGVGEMRNPHEIAQNVRDTLGDDSKAEDCQYFYRLITRSHPQFHEFKSWYGDNGFEIPIDSDVSKATIKHWYVSDGGFNWSSKIPHISFGSKNHSKNPEPLVNLLEQHEWEVNQSNYSFCLPSSQTEDFLDWIGEPCCDDFAYKWEWQDRERYDELKEQAFYGIEKGKEVQL